jgi:hypothetical protein
LENLLSCCQCTERDEGGPSRDAERRAEHAPNYSQLDRNPPSRLSVCSMKSVIPVSYRNWATARSDSVAYNIRASGERLDKSPELGTFKRSQNVLLSERSENNRTIRDLDPSTLVQFQTARRNRILSRLAERTLRR